MLRIDRLPRLATPIRWACYGALMSLPVSVAGLNLFLGMAVLLALVSYEFWKATPGLVRHPIAILAILMFGLLAIGTLYSSAPDSESFKYLWRYKKLILIPLLIPFFQESHFRYLAIRFFSLAVFLTVLASWSEFFQLTHLSDPAYGDFTGDSVFVMHITQGYLFAMLVALSLSLFFATKNLYAKAAWLIIAAITTADICLVMWGKTGKATLIILVIWGCWEWLNAQNWRFITKSIIQVICVCSVLGGTAIAAKNPALSFGVIQAELEHSDKTGDITSQGLRKQFAKTGVLIFLKSPWVGHGTGSIVTEQALFAKEANTPVGQVITVNLHNEYLMQAAQVGILGVALFIAWIAITWFYSLSSVLAWEGIALRGVTVVFASGCLFNSYLWDHIEGYTFILLLTTLIPMNRITHQHFLVKNS